MNSILADELRSQAPWLFANNNYNDNMASNLSHVINKNMNRDQLLPHVGLEPTTSAVVYNHQHNSSAPNVGGNSKKYNSSDNACVRCGYESGDILFVQCGCLVHVRCLPWPRDLTSNPTVQNGDNGTTVGTKPRPGPLQQCPFCNASPCSLLLQPMKFEELDQARKEAMLLKQNKQKSNKKRKQDANSTNEPDTAASTTSNTEASQLHHSTSAYDDADCRTGRWSNEETIFCNKLISFFTSGQFPIADGTKMNEFLANILKLKQSRLTKKMKNANLAAKHFLRRTGYIETDIDCIEFSKAEFDFLNNLGDIVEAADLKFHMQLFWREAFSLFCSTVQQPLDARDWLTTVEEMERRASYNKDAARMAKRKVFMGYALDIDLQNPDSGIFIDGDISPRQNHAASTLENSIHSGEDLDELVALISSDPAFLSSVLPSAEQSNNKNTTAPCCNATGANTVSLSRSTTNRILGKSSGHHSSTDMNRNSWHFSSPFLAKVISIIQKRNLPFEYIDAWVPSETSGDRSSGSRLYFAGNAIVDVYTVPSTPATAASDSSINSGQPQMAPLTQDERFNLLCFGDYSEKFSFNIGSGLPGRVYASGSPIWQENLGDAPLIHFERSGGAKQFGIKTAVGFPVSSPNVGRIVVCCYSKFDRSKDADTVHTMLDELEKLVPSPRWKLIIDLGKSAKEPHSRPRSSDGDLPSIVNSNTHNTLQPPRNKGELPSMVNNFLSNALSSSRNDVDIPSLISNYVNNLPSSRNEPSNIANELVNREAIKSASPPNSNLPESNLLYGRHDRNKDELIAILGEHMPLDSSSELAFCLPGLVSLRLMLLKSNRSPDEEDIIATIMNSFASCRSSRLSNAETAVLLARDFTLLKQLQQQRDQSAAAVALHQWSTGVSQLPQNNSFHPHSMNGSSIPFQYQNYKISNNSMTPLENALQQQYESALSMSGVGNNLSNNMSGNLSHSLNDQSMPMRNNFQFRPR